MAMTSSFTDSAGGTPLLNPNHGDMVWAGLAAVSPADPGGNAPASLLTPEPENPPFSGDDCEGPGDQLCDQRGQF